MNYFGVGVGVVWGICLVEEEVSLLYMGFWRTARVVYDIRTKVEGWYGWLWSLWSCFSSSICIINVTLFKSSS
jgi:hypothetical protein